MAISNDPVATYFPSLTRCGNSDPYRHFLILTAVLFKVRSLSINEPNSAISIPDRSYWSSLSGLRTRRPHSKILSGCEDIDSKNPDLFRGSLIKLCRYARGERHSTFEPEAFREYVNEWSNIPLESCNALTWRRISEQFAAMHGVNDSVRPLPSELGPLISGLLSSGQCLFLGPLRQNLATLNTFIEKVEGLEIDGIDTSSNVGDQTAAKLLLWLCGSHHNVRIADSAQVYDTTVLVLTSAIGDRHSAYEVQLSSTLIDRALAFTGDRGTVFTVLPDGFLAGIGPEVEVRRKLLSARVVDAVIRLPSTQKKRTAASLSMLILKRKPQNPRQTIHFIDRFSRQAWSATSSDSWVSDVLSLYRHELSPADQSTGFFHSEIDYERIESHATCSLDPIDYYQPLSSLGDGDLAERGALEKEIERRNRLECDILKLIEMLSAD